jgi:hypothetical protein
MRRSIHFKDCDLRESDDKVPAEMTERVSGATALWATPSARRMSRSHRLRLYLKARSETPGDFVFCVSETVEAVAIFG